MYHACKEIFKKRDLRKKSHGVVWYYTFSSTFYHNWYKFNTSHTYSLQFSPLNKDWMLNVKGWQSYVIKSLFYTNKYTFFFNLKASFDVLQWHNYVAVFFLKPLYFRYYWLYLFHINKISYMYIQYHLNAQVNIFKMHSSIIDYLLIPVTKSAGVLSQILSLAFNKPNLPKYSQQH